MGQVRDVQDGEENIPLDETHWTTHGKILGKSTRSKLAGIEDPDVIYLRAITSPLDRLSDVDADIIEAYKAGNHRNLKQEDVKAIRTNAGIDNIPQLIIYRIDRNSQPERANTNREALNSAHDLIGLQVCIPGGRTNFVKAVQAQLNEDNEADNLEEQD